VQQVRFGLSLDGQRGWQLRDALGEPVVGPLGMLTLLETQLGLLRVGPAQPERVVQMRECLHAARTGGRFYEASFAVDELGTAATLLGWRDLWHLHGWDGTVAAQASPRLRDMAAVEALEATRVAPGVGQRLHDVEAMLGIRRPQIASVTLLDPLADFPLRWRRVLARLPVADCVPAQPSASAGTLLRELQERLLAAHAGGRPPKLAWRDDGSVRIVRGESPLAAAQWLAQRIGRCEHGHAVVAERAGALLDAALAAQDLPRRGLGQPSAFRPTLQLLAPLIRTNTRWTRAAKRQKSAFEIYSLARPGAGLRRARGGRDRAAIVDKCLAERTGPEGQLGVIRSRADRQGPGPGRIDG
jgi:hypothetical protein